MNTATLTALLTRETPLSYAEIDAVEAAILALPVAEATALVRGGKSRQQVAARVCKRLAERTGRMERGEEIGRIAAGGR